jgi:hypothetical protein
MKALRRPLARLLLQAFVEARRVRVARRKRSVLRGGATMVFKYQGRLNFREGERVQ